MGHDRPVLSSDDGATARSGQRLACMLAAIAPSSPIAFAVLIFCFVLVLAFAFSNGFHDTANAVATVIYTHSLRPVPAVLLSGTLNFPGVVLGGIAVAFTLVELLPPAAERYQVVVGGAGLRGRRPAGRRVSCER